jgi:hypothetical protein
MNWPLESPDPALQIASPARSYINAYFVQLEISRYLKAFAHFTLL